jgi:hypothetical protein
LVSEVITWKSQASVSNCFTIVEWNFESSDGKAVTYADLALPGDDFRYQCVMAAGASWEKSTFDKKSGAVDVKAHCEISKDKLTALDKDAKKLDQDVTLNAALTYEELFAGFNAAGYESGNWDTSTGVAAVEDGALAVEQKDDAACPVAYDKATFKTDKTGAIDVTWKTNDDSTAG